MERILQNFEEVIRRAQEGGKFPMESKLVLRGRIDYAVSRGDLTQNEARRLDEILGDDLTGKYRKEIEIAAFGDAEDE